MAKKEKELQLIYVLKIGENHRNEGIYEFIFSYDPDQLDPKSWGWDTIPANLNANPPDEHYIDSVKILKTDKIKLDVLHESEFFSYLDGYDKVIALAWENLEYNIDNDGDRIVFHYKDSVENVEDKLYAKDLKLDSK